MKEQKQLKYSLIAALMVLLFNYPLLDIANKNKYINNIPVLYIYMATIWLLVIILLSIVSGSKKRPNR